MGSGGSKAESQTPAGKGSSNKKAEKTAQAATEVERYSPEVTEAADTQPIHYPEPLRVTPREEVRHL